MAKKKGKSSAKVGKGSSLMSKLKKLGTSFKKAKPRRSGFPIPDDDYAATIVSAIIEEARSTGRLQINYLLRVIEGDYEGKEFHKYAGLETEDNLDYALGDLEVLELELPAEISDLGTVLEEAANLSVDVTIRTSDSFTNIDFNELLAEGSEDDADEDDADEDEEEVEEADDDDAEEEEEEEEDDDDSDTEDGEGEDWPTEKEIKKMPADELKELAKELGLKTKKFKTQKKLAQACIDDIYEEEDDD